MKSMTGYGKASFINENFEIEIDIKSVNNKGLDLKISSCRELYFLDSEIKELVVSRIKRGKVDVRISFRDKQLPVIEVDESRVKAYHQMLLQIKESLNIEDDIKIDTIVNQPDVVVIKQAEYDNEGFRGVLLGCLRDAIDRHQVLAMKEGDALKAFFQESFDCMDDCLKRIKETIPQHKELLKTKLISEVNQILNSTLNPDMEKRVLLEVALYLERCDITEELIRMESHLKNIWECMSGGRLEIGKSLGFILQEMQREANTISSKYTTTTTFNDVLRLKEEIEKCREQIHNVE
jgi:uncharacterized protein (TIGR00255 family)